AISSGGSACNANRNTRSRCSSLCVPNFEFIVRSICFPAPLEVSPVRSGFASSRFREVDSTSLPLPHRSIQKKMCFRSPFVLLYSGLQAHSATGGSAPQTDRPVVDQQHPL